METEHETPEEAGVMIPLGALCRYSAGLDQEDPEALLFDKIDVLKRSLERACELLDEYADLPSNDLITLRGLKVALHVLDDAQDVIDRIKEEAKRE